MMWGRTPPGGRSPDGRSPDGGPGWDDGGPGAGDRADKGDKADREDRGERAEWLAREVNRLAEENDRLRVALEDITDSLAWRYVVRSNRGLNRDERAAVDRALVVLTADPELEGAGEKNESASASVHPSVAPAPAGAERPRLRLLK